MISIYVCSSSIHQCVDSQGPLLVEGVEADRPIYKVLRAVMKSDPNVQNKNHQLEDFALHKCHCDQHLQFNLSNGVGNGNHPQIGNGSNGKGKGKGKGKEVQVEGQHPSTLDAINGNGNAAADQDAELDPYSTLDQLNLKHHSRIFIRLRPPQPPAIPYQPTSTKSKPKSRKRSNEWISTSSDLNPFSTNELQSLSEEGPKDREEEEGEEEEEEFTPFKAKKPKGGRGVYVEGTDKTCLSAGLLAPEALGVRDSITTLLGGDTWLSQKVTSEIPITTRDHGSLRALKKAIKQYMEMENLNGKTLKGKLPDPLCKLFTKCYKKRQLNASMKAGIKISEFQNLRKADFNDATRLMELKAERKAKGEQSPPEESEDEVEDDSSRNFTLEEHAEAIGGSMSACRHISWLWKNEDWLTQPPLEGLKPITMNPYLATQLRSLATLTKVKPSEPSPPTGWPLVVQRALKMAMDQQAPKDPERQRKSAMGARGWSQSRDIPLAISLLKRGEVEGFVPRPEDFLEVKAPKEDQQQSVLQQHDLLGGEDEEVDLFGGSSSNPMGNHHHHEFSDVEMIANASVHGMNANGDYGIMGYPSMSHGGEVDGNHHHHHHGVNGQELGLGEGDREYGGDHVDPNSGNQAMLNELENHLGGYSNNDSNHHQQQQQQQQQQGPSTLPNLPQLPPNENESENESENGNGNGSGSGSGGNPRRSIRNREKKKTQLEQSSISQMNQGAGKIRQLDSDEETEIDLDEDGNPL